MNEFLNSNNISYLEDASLIKYNTYRVDAKVKYLVFPDSVDQLVTLVKYIKDNNVEYFILGGGSNIIFAKEYYDRVFISLSKLNTIDINGYEVTAGAGGSLMLLANKLIDMGLSGLDFASGLPGTVGGATVGNAGCYGSSMDKVVKSVLAIDSNLELVALSNKEINYEYRSSRLKGSNYIVISVTFLVTDGDKELMKEERESRRAKRISAQPLEYPSAGSVFRNPEGNYAGKLIEDLGLKGFSVNDACVSMKHANFIINNGHAKGEDIINLINIIKRKVKENYDIDLVLEQIIVN